MDRPRLTATYRVQLNADFGFDAARAAVPYLARLGVSHLYCSPVLAARPGSTHGYDVVDPSRPNEALGGEAGLRALADALHAHGMGLVLDIVPNHMGAGPDNPYWTDVLRWGRASRYAPWFDLDWGAEGAARGGRVVLPVLGDQLDAVIERDELTVAFRDGSFVVDYFEHAYPLDPRTVHRLFAFQHRFEYGAGDGDDPGDALLRIRDVLFPERGVPLTPEAAASAVDELATLVARAPVARAYVDATLGAFAAGDAGSYRLRALLDLQPWTLADWRTGLRDVNYRRFFDVNDLLGVRVEDPAVFDATHECVLAWVADGIVDGVRVDHVDGLRDPLVYLQRLRAALDARRPGEHVPILVEKILSPGERLRADWPVDGTTGYEFAAQLEPALVDPVGYDAIEASYRQLLRLGARAVDFHEIARRGKELVLRRALQPDVRRLVRLLDPVARAAKAGLTRPQLGEAIIQMLVAMPVYRTYVRAEAVEVDGRVSTRWTVSDGDRAIVDRALADALGRGAASAEALRFVARALVGEAFPEAAFDVPRAPRRATFVDPLASAREFALRFQQTSGPATAKGVEDTALYRWFPLASLGEVGAEPLRPPDDALARFHDANRERQAAWPDSMLGVTTHDTKRTADVRARLDALAEVPTAWRSLVTRWRARHAPLRARRDVGGRERVAPEPNTEYLIYQTLLGLWPTDAADDAADDAARAWLCERVTGYLQKATREAKGRTSWTEPNEPYERGVAAFVRALVVEPAGARFREELGALAERVGRAGRWNALARLAIHLTSPGTPDLYQGDERWLLALVDPDNRRPVDFAAQAAALDALDALGRDAPPVDRLLGSPDDGLVKLNLARRVLRSRRAEPGLWSGGAYAPVAAEGRSARHVVAFARLAEGRAALTVAARFPLLLRDDGRPPVGEETWQDSALVLPDGLAGATLHDLVTGRSIPVAGDRLLVADVLATLPAAVLVGDRR